MAENRMTMDIEEICSLYSQRLFHVAYSITRDHHHAQDVVQDTFIKAYQKLDTLEDHSKVGAWLSSIATRTAIDYVRKEKRKSEVFLENSIVESNQLHFSSSQDVEKEVELALFEEEIQHVINNLSTDQKNVFLLKIKAGLKEKEIAEKLKLKQGTVKTNLYRAKRHLKSMMVERSLA
ncbi:RNA polymerase sigma factor [Cytobacillus sp. FJAT-54145]|uniref:RNA polymerase sigma factor n=1 Tax=Cytobacillus spartinae TaxID=3299023 RepID=A0ABW6K602_9BACI